jgi:predicted transcriptional regulator
MSRQLNGKVRSMSRTQQGDANRDGHDEEQIQRRAEVARALARGGMENVQVISWESAREVTPERRRLLGTLRTTDVDSIADLAREVDRAESQVSRDLSTLAELGLVSFEERGRAKRPVLTQSTVVVEPLV